MSEFFIAPIVEGHGEVQSVPILLQRILEELLPNASLRLNPALRVKPGSFLKDDGYFARHLELAARKVKPHSQGLVLILLDCEDDCPAQVGPALAAKATRVRSDVQVIVVLACREYETWFLASANSLRGINGIPMDVVPPADPVAIRGAKEWLDKRMPGGYNEVKDQRIFTKAFSLNEAASVPSFSRLHSKLRRFFLHEC